MLDMRFGWPIVLLVFLPACDERAGYTAADPPADVRPGSPTFADSFGFGRPATPAEVAAWDIDVMADGTGLPAGRGTVGLGAGVYAEKCAACHGAEGEGGAAIGLVGRLPDDLFPFAEDPTVPRRIGSYWPYAPTLFDYIRRAMPYDRPGSLTDDEVYGVTAFLLYKNDLLAQDALVDAETLPIVQMPARDRFVADDRLDYDVIR